MPRSSCAVYASLIVSVHLIIIGIALLVAGVFQTLITNRLKGEVTLTEGSRVFDTWKNPPLAVSMQFYFFNVTNPDDFLAGAKPRVVTVGPYTYRQYRPKVNVTFVENGSKVSALTEKTYVFIPELSVGDPSEDNITTVNIPAVAVMNKLKDSGFFTKMAISAFMGSIGSTMFMTHTVDELLWGFKDPLLSRLRTMKPEVDEYFGLMLNKNVSNDGEFVYFTGEQDYLEYSRIDTWKGQKMLSLWGTNQTNMINGTDGSAFHPFLTKEERLEVFTPDLCRSIYMLFEKEVEVKGIPAYRFTPPRDVLASAKNNPANEGFCLDKSKCLDDGVLAVGVCRKGAPVVVSFPHFHLGDQKYVDAIEGLNPIKEHHQTFLDLNPTIGVPIRASKKAQINILLDRVSGFVMTRNLNSTIFPVMFINESVTIDDATAAKLHKLLSITKIVPNFPFILIAMGVILFLVSILLIIRSRQKKREVKRFDFAEAYCSGPTTAKTDTAYSPVSAKADDPAEKNGTYVGMNPIEKS